MPIVIGTFCTITCTIFFFLPVSMWKEAAMAAFQGNFLGSCHPGALGRKAVTDFPGHSSLKSRAA